METRTFGRTGTSLSPLGLGCQRLVDWSSCSERDARRILERAFERGIRYFDTAWLYGLGQSEERLGHLAREHRPELWLATKSADRSRDGAMRQLEDSLRRLQTDHVDEWRLHNLATLDDVEKCFAAGGAIHAAVEAREQGLTRHIGISGHTHPRVLLAALDRFPFDSVLFPGSVLDSFVSSFVESLLPRANREGVAAVAMKALAQGALSRHAEAALRYSLTLPVSMVIVGCSRLAELEGACDALERFSPLDDESRQRLLTEVRPLVTPANLPWRTPDGGKGGAWIE